MGHEVVGVGESHLGWISCRLTVGWLELHPGFSGWVRNVVRDWQTMWLILHDSFFFFLSEVVIVHKVWQNLLSHYWGINKNCINVLYTDHSFFSFFLSFIFTLFYFTILYGFAIHWHESPWVYMHSQTWSFFKKQKQVSLMVGLTLL